MKALTVLQPYSGFILLGEKRIETRWKEMIPNDPRGRNPDEVRGGDQ